MKIAIHHTPGSFSERWINYCEEKGISYKVVNAYDSDIIEQVRDSDAFMWHHHHANYKDALFAKQLLYSLQIAGKKVFPDFNTGWHFDDKVGQKYLLEAIDAPLVPSFVFYSKKEALSWIKKTTFPKVFKLRGGAGASNVKLVKTPKEAVKIVNKAFGSGFSQFDRWGYLKERFNKWQQGRDSFIGVIKGIGRLFVPTSYEKMHSKEKGYVYFQEFIPGNRTDFRIKVVNGRCWGFQRKVRDNDFRASGSGCLIFNNSQIPVEMVTIALDVAKKLSLQSVAFDFVIDKKYNKCLIVEMSYGFGFDENETRGGYWDYCLIRHEELFSPFDWMIEGMLK